MGQRWTEASPTTRVAAAAAAAVVQFSLLGAALVDLRRRDREQVKGPKWAWALTSLINFIGPIAYFVAGRRR